MPVSVSRSEDFLHLMSAALDDSRLVDYFASRPNNPALDAWLLAQIGQGSERAHALLRTARMAHSVVQAEEGTHHLTIGIPIVLASSVSFRSKGWAVARVELEEGLARVTGALSIRLQEAPRHVDVFHALGATGWSRIQAELLEAAPSSDTSSDDVTAGPKVWMGMAVFPEVAQKEMEHKLFAQNPEVGAQSRSVLMRAEALLEEAGIASRVFPPTAAWNSLSLARLYHARQALGAPENCGLRLELALPWLRLVDSTGVRFSAYFPEELEQHVRPLAQWYESKSA